MTNKLTIYPLSDFEHLRRAGKLASQTLDYITPFVVPGVSTGKLDALLEAFMRDNGGIPATIGYNGYTKASCISPNHVICHGIPSDDKFLQDGDIINIDITVILNGWYGDTSRMYYVGKPGIKAKRLVETTYDTMMAGIYACKPGNTTGDIGYAMQRLAEGSGYSVVPDFCGHGIGQVFHGLPNILNYGTPGTGTELIPGLVFTVEPMVNVGTHRSLILADGWTAITKDRSLSAQFEHMVGITETGVEIFTLSEKGYTVPPYLETNKNK
ncbi:MAG: type I methionyl aminopeptidase [Lactobacillales bacterium]|jgi:methionyl aminopeptidase|nr:type I methionyl aminopeptidase [Lactobacillales bacterium]